MEQLSGKTALVTGSTDGVGRLVARKLGQAGARVLVHGRDAERGARVVADIEASGGAADFLAADLSALAEVRSLADAAQATVDGRLGGSGSSSQQDPSLAPDRPVRLPGSPDRKFKTDEAGVAGKWCRLKSVVGPSAWAIEVRGADMTRAELDAALARLGLAVPEGERDQIVAAAHLIEGMVARLRPVGGRDVAAEPAHVVRFPES